MSITTLYRMFGPDGGLLYIGISSRAAMRWEQHRHDKPWWSAVARITVEHFATREAALSAELAAIRAERPKYNIAGAIRELVVPTGEGEWTRLVELEPRLNELLMQVRGATLCGCSSEPLCSWYGYCDDVRSTCYRERLGALVGWTRGVDWAWRDPPLALHEDGWITARELCSLPDPPEKSAFEAAERSAGRGWLLTEAAYDVAADRLLEALPWSKQRRTA